LLLHQLAWIATDAMLDTSLIRSNNTTTRVNTDSSPQSHLCLLGVGWQTRFDEGGLIIGTPEILVKIAGSLANYDFGEKRDVCEAAGDV
jgi:hypothetical protein